MNSSSTHSAFAIRTTFVPALTLLWLVGGAAGLAVAGAFWPAAQAAWLIALGGIVAFAVGDLLYSLGIASGTTPRVTAPAVVRFSKDAPGDIPLTFCCDHVGEAPPAAPRRLRFALGLSGASFVETQPELLVELPADARAARVDWTCTPTRRGRYAEGLLACCEMVSRLGLWRLRTRQSVACELRVYPNLFSERRSLAALFLNRGQAGLKVQRTVGRGREFEKLRDYLPGDSFDEVHWKATAKRGRVITKVFQAERTQEVYAVIDLSRLSGRELAHEDGGGGGGEGRRQRVLTVLERYLTSALVLMLAARQQGDRFGLVAYDDQVRVFIRAGNGSAHYAACREAVCTLASSEATPDMAELTRHLRTELRTRALLVFLSDLSDPVLAEDFVRQGPLLARRHLVMVNQLRTPGVARLFTGGPVAAGDDGAVYARLAGHLRWAEAQSLARRLKPAGITAALLENEELAAQVVAQYMSVKRRQIL
ncbi:DUF58 domain-containing protein [Geminisphaera colitermitum]|uniref:DUF58 domain-containing protein n=1 Tax=Geminisphaera colitermitum TaxID=1148786 RepID=UPI0001964E12|nr:DUF58 domain-containing protein [Geminisphaera colitermitum]